MKAKGIKTGKIIMGAVVLLAFFYALFCGIGTKADGNIIVVSSRIQEQDVYLYLRNFNDSISLNSVQIGSQMCESKAGAPILQTGLPIQTTILIDNSNSVANAYGDTAKEIMHGIVNNHAEGEMFRIVTFSNQLTELNDYSNDYDAINNEIDGIEYQNQQTYFTDVVYELLQKEGQLEQANYTRYIIITDGADDNEITYTQSELTELMKNSRIPLITIGATTGNNQSSLELLFSYSRITNGYSFMTEKNADITSIVDGIASDYALYCLKISPEAAVLDGSEKQVRIEFTDAEGNIMNTTATVRMPFNDGSSAVAEPAPDETTEDASEETTEETVEEPVVETSPSAMPVIGGETQQEDEKGFAIPKLAIIIGASVLALIVVVVVIIIIVNSKKKKPAPEEQMIVSVPKQPEPTPEPEHTLMMNNAMPDSNDGSTHMLWGAVPQNNKHYTVVLRNINNLSEEYSAPIVDKIVIGRKEGDIIINTDNYISGKQCEIIKKGELFYLHNLSSSNITRYNGKAESGEIPIIENGVIGMGQHEMKISFLEE